MTNEEREARRFHPTAWGGMNVAGENARTRRSPGDAGGGAPATFGEGVKGASSEAVGQAHVHDFREKELWPELHIVGCPRGRSRFRRCICRMVAFVCDCGEVGFAITRRSA